MNPNTELLQLDKELARLRKYDELNDVITLRAIIKNLERQNELLREKDKLVKSRTSQT